MPKNDKPTSDTTEQLIKLRSLFSDDLPSRVNRAAELWEQIELEWNRDKALELLNIVHKLAGSCSLFGYPQLGQVARQIEVIVDQYIQLADSEDVEIENVSLLVKTLTSPALRETNEDSKEFIAFLNTPSIKSKEKIVYVLDDNYIFAKTVATQLKNYGFEASYFIDVPTFLLAIEQQRPHAIIVDVKLKESENSGIQVVHQVKFDMAMDIPTIVFTVREDFVAKLESYRAGANAYIIKPVEIDSLAAEIDRLAINTDVSEPLRILIVDDDEQLAIHTSLILENSGMITQVVTEPYEACDAIANLNPDLIVLDLYMPSCSGMELAGVIRFHPEYLHIPIVFLSSETESERKLAALKTGSDDFLSKPIDPYHFTESIRIRALRSRRVNQVAVHDSLTGLLNHAALKDRLHQEFSRTLRTGYHFTFAMIDIDNFEKINNQFGHLMGDRVISSLARMLKKRLRYGDVCGRFGGEEFAVILADCSCRDAQRLIDHFRETFSEHDFVFQHEKFRVTFSVGLVSSQDVQLTDSLIQIAEAELFSAKKDGKNCVRSFSR